MSRSIAYNLTTQKETLGEIVEKQNLAAAVRRAFSSLRKAGVSARIIHKNCGFRSCGCKACTKEREVMSSPAWVLCNQIESARGVYLSHGGEALDYEKLDSALREAGLSVKWSGFLSEAMLLSVEEGK